MGENKRDEKRSSTHKTKAKVPPGAAALRVGGGGEGGGLRESFPFSSWKVRWATHQGRAVANGGGLGEGGVGWVSRRSRRATTLFPFF